MADRPGRMIEGSDYEGRAKQVVPTAYNLLIRNDEGEDSEICSMFEIVERDEDGIVGCIRPSADNLPPDRVAICRSHILPIGYVARAAHASHHPVAVAYDPSAGTPVVGETVGTAAGEWTAAAGGDGFRVVRVDETNGIVWVVPAFGQGGGGVTLQLVQVQSDGASGVVSVKNIALGSDPAALPNYQTTGEAYNLNYLRG